MSSLIGQSVGRYHVLEQLGEGGMATVYKAFDTRLDREVALKVILPSRQQAPKFLKRFEREAKALAQLSHPNIVKIMDYGEHEGLPYLVMEYTPAGTLKDRLGEPMPWSEAARVLAPIARALQYAHGRKIVHRDVKPSNILMTESGQPMLSDFGIAKVLEAEETWDLTGTGVGIGTPEYMAPEQGMGKPVDRRADIYALGIVLYELVTGRKPFQADTPLAVLLKQVNDPLPRPRGIVPDLAKGVEQVIFKALAKRPEDRFQEMGSFAAAVEKLAKGEKVTIEGGRRLALRRLEKRLAVSPTLVGIVVVMIALVAASVLLPQGVLSLARPDPTQALALVTEIAQTARAEQDATASQAAVELQMTSTQRAGDRNATATIVALTPTMTPSITPTMTPTPTKAYVDGSILFADDFEDGDANDWMIGTLGWEVLQDETGNYLLRGSMEPDPEPNGSLHIGTGSTSWQDYAFEFRARIVQGERESLNARIRFNDQLDSGCQAYRLIMEGADLSLNLIGDHAPQCGVFLDRHPTNLGDGGWHVVRMEAFGSEVAVYIDGELLLYVNDPEPIENGRIEFEVRQGSTVDFDDVRVIELIPLEESELPAANPTPADTPAIGLTPSSQLPECDPNLSNTPCQLNRDLTLAPGTYGSNGIFIRSSLTLDCSGATLNGSNQDSVYAVSIADGVSDVEVRNCTIRNYDPPNHRGGAIEVGDGGNNKLISNIDMDYVCNGVAEGSGSNYVVENSTYWGNRLSPGNCDVAIQIWFDEGSVVRSNTIYMRDRGFNQGAFGGACIAAKFEDNRVFSAVAQEFSPVVTLYSMSVGCEFRYNLISSPGRAMLVEGVSNSIYGNTFRFGLVEDAGTASIWCVDDIGNDYSDGATYQGSDPNEGTCPG